MTADKEKVYKYYSLRQLPMVAGLLAPVCVLLSIPPLTGSWISKDDNILNYNRRSFQTDKIILGLLGTGLVSLFTAHFTLLLRFLERHIVWNTWISITGYFINFCLTLGAALYYQFNFPVQQGYHYSGEYYAAYGSSIISFTISSFLIIDFFKHNHLKGKGSGLSRNQRVLVFMGILVTLWIVLGALVMGSFEDWSFTRGIYFTLVTLTTIGFGDYAPSSAHARGFNIFYASIGIIMVGMFIAFIRSVILESFEHAYLEKMEQIGTLGLDNFYTMNFPTHSKGSKSQDLGQSEEKVERAKTVKDQEKELKKAQLAQYIRQLHFSVFALFLFWFLGAGIFCWLEPDWDYFTAFYFCFISFTTIGYGDITVKPFSSVVAFCVYSLMGLVTMAYFISVATELFSCLIETHGDRIERKRKRKAKSTIGQHKDQYNPNNIGDPQRDIDLLEALEQSTGNEEKDLIQKLLTMTEFYHQEVTRFVKGVAANQEELDDEDAQLNSFQLKKMEKYEKIYGQLINLCKKKLNNSSSVGNLVPPPQTIQASLIRNESSEFLIEPSSRHTFGNY